MQKKIQINTVLNNHCKKYTKLKPRILVTGAGGSLAKTIIPLMEELNYEVFGVVKRNPQKKFMVGDVGNLKSIQTIIRKIKPDIIIHLAGLTGNFECQNNPSETFRTNVLGTFNILLSSIERKPKIIFASSREVYGNCKTKANEKSLLNPINLNGMSKMLSENMIVNFNQVYQIPYIILRYTNFYESDMNRGISVMIRNAFVGKSVKVFGGEQKIDLIHVDDAARAVMLSIKYKKSDVFNIGSGKSISIKNLLQQISTISKKKIAYHTEPYRQFEVRNFKADIRKAQRFLNFHPTIQIDEGLKQFHNE